MAPYDTSHAPADPSHTAALAVADTSALSARTATASSTERVCALCNRSLAGRRPETLTCSSRCRSAVARQRRRDDLLARVRRAEMALRDAADALASLKELAGLDATLELGSLLNRGGAA